ncbi:MAG: nucleoside monophosphate kinase [Alphaproteobacteria bacterium]|nr:nucleoside monophosphate kinase [Alphaproteobacteria bacterium]MBL0717726.1 nucleoside monophosphate kinase [Alphaproteobacteria bacterium]
MKYAILIGEPNSGKSTFANQFVKMAKDRGLFISILKTGNSIREYVKKNPNSDIKEKMNRGELVGNEIPKAYMIEEIRKYNLLEKKPDLILMDGTPRNLSQKDEFKPDVFDRYGLELHSIIFISLSVEEIFERASNRGRDDDKVEIVRCRIDNFKKDTLPMLNYYKITNESKFRELDGKLPVEDKVRLKFIDEIINSILR